MDPSRGVQRPRDGDIGWLKEASATALGTDASSPSAFEGVPSSFLAVFITEIGDKTFFLAMLLAVRHGKLAVFVATVSAMFFMTLGSTFTGYLLSESAETLEASVQWMDFVAAAVFIAFAAQLLRDAHRLHVKDQNDQEVRSLLGGDGGYSTQHGELLDAEETLQEEDQKEGGKVKTWWGGVYQTFCLMFVAEWGDRSMFATMALATQHAPLGVICGTMCAHALANSIAVVGGEMLGNVISEKYMALAGAVVFLTFGVASLYEGITNKNVPLV
jgi:putative Ca2+/H+ antiporter (TMEM165/GDT1 family)